MEFDSTIEKNYQAEKNELESEKRICPYCEKERSEISLYGSIDNDFDYSCTVCNLEYINWLHNKSKHSPYENARLQKEVERELKNDKKNNDSEWRPHLKTIAERSQIFQPKLKEIK